MPAPFAFVEDKNFYLQHAIMRSNYNLARRLLLTMNKVQKNKVDKEGHTPLYFAVEKQMYSLILILMNDPEIDKREKQRFLVP